jgi:hypothetical protein
MQDGMAKSRKSWTWCRNQGKTYPRHDGREIKHDIPKKARDIIEALGLQGVFSDYREFRTDAKL